LPLEAFLPKGTEPRLQDHKTSSLLRDAVQLADVAKPMGRVTSTSSNNDLLREIMSVVFVFFNALLRRPLLVVR